MNEIECETCIKRKTVYCPNHVDCYDTINKPYYQNRIMLLEENKQLKEQLEKERKVRKEAVEFMKDCEFDKTDKYIAIGEYQEYKDLLNVLDIDKGE